MGDLSKLTEAHSRAVNGHVFLRNLGEVSEGLRAFCVLLVCVQCNVRHLTQCWEPCFIPTVPFSCSARTDRSAESFNDKTALEIQCLQSTVCFFYTWSVTVATCDLNSLLFYTYLCGSVSTSFFGGAVGCVHNRVYIYIGTLRGSYTK